MRYRLPVYRVALVREGSVPTESRIIRGPHDVADILREFFGQADREHFAVLCLDIRHRVIAINEVAVGTLDRALVHPREVFKPAILTNAAALILGHTHPSGDPEPSRADMEITRRLARAGELLSIPVLDHVIIGDGQFVSLRERGDLPAPAA